MAANSATKRGTEVAGAAAKRAILPGNSAANRETAATLEMVAELTAAETVAVVPMVTAEGEVERAVVATAADMEEVMGVGSAAVVTAVEAMVAVEKAVAVTAAAAKASRMVSTPAPQSRAACEKAQAAPKSHNHPPKVLLSCRNGSQTALPNLAPPSLARRSWQTRATSSTAPST